MAFLLNACEKAEKTSSEFRVISKELFDNTPYNRDLSNFSKTVCKALAENKVFSSIIKEEVIKQFDGDYDVLLSAIAEMRLPEKELTTKGVSYLTVKDMLNRYAEGGSAEGKGGNSESFIDMLMAKYPLLQVSVPVNAEKWVDEKYVPVVTFIPFEYDELSTRFVTGYRPDGEMVMIDAVTPPDEPVIVIGLNERVSVPGDETKAAPPAPTGLTCVTTEAGIRLGWGMPAEADATNTHGYHIYRKSTSDINFIRIATISGVNNKSYDDKTVTAISSYTYFVTAFYESTESVPSNYVTITAPALPKPVLDFEAIQHARNLVELRWQNDNSQYIEETHLYKLIVGEDADYVLLNSFPVSQHDYFDTNIKPGKKIIYKAVHVTRLGVSNPKYDFIQAPYRDISQYSPVYIKQIKFTDWSIEGWLAGKPEFYITVTNVDPVNKNPFKVQDEINCEFSKRSSLSQVFYGVKVLDWKPGLWYDMLTFTAIEYDKPSGDLAFEIGVGFNAKNVAKLDFITPTAGVKYSVKFQDKGEKCGNAYINYFDFPEKWLVFPNYGVQILLSESDN